MRVDRGARLPLAMCSSDSKTEIIASGWCPVRYNFLSVAEGVSVICCQIC